MNWSSPAAKHPEAAPRQAWLPADVPASLRALARASQSLGAAGAEAGAPSFERSYASQPPFTGGASWQNGSGSRQAEAHDSQHQEAEPSRSVLGHPFLRSDLAGYFVSFPWLGIEFVLRSPQGADLQTAMRIHDRALISCFGPDAAAQRGLCNPLQAYVSERFFRELFSSAQAPRVGVWDPLRGTRDARDRVVAYLSETGALAKARPAPHRPAPPRPARPTRPAPPSPQAEAILPPSSGGPSDRLPSINPFAQDPRPLPMGHWHGGPPGADGGPLPPPDRLCAWRQHHTSQHYPPSLGPYPAVSTSSHPGHYPASPSSHGPFPAPSSSSSSSSSFPYPPPGAPPAAHLSMQLPPPPFPLLHRPPPPAPRDSYAHSQSALPPAMPYPAPPDSHMISARTTAPAAAPPRAAETRCAVWPARGTAASYERRIPAGARGCRRGCGWWGGARSRWTAAGPPDAPDGRHPRDARSLVPRSLKVASEHIGLSTTTLKKICRQMRIYHWPYRTLPVEHSRGSAASREPGRGDEQP
eukprot:tig00000741_g3823.t1